ncbi:MAG: glycosyltransferase family 2 protein [Lachnospiraceae bacterium]|nr:glycosyltransferase family 2 protein [Lachnospiraceae bacterium]MDE6251497.1 glycosyltransferase family 2 protein [Lachnospiraceae bacterium]
MKKVTLIIPCYNEEEMIHLLYKELCKAAERLYSMENMQYETEMIFIDDGSVDKTLKLIKELRERDTKVRYLSFSRNFGKEAAMYAGLCNASGDYVAVLDADLQDPPSLVPEMVKILESGDYDSVAARRVSRKGEMVIRSCFARLFYKIMNKMLDSDIKDGARDFRLMKREVVQVIIEMKEYNRFFKGIFGWIGFRTYWYEYENVERAAGISKWNFLSLLRYSMNGILNFSWVPLAAIPGLGIICVLIALVFGMVILVGKWGGTDFSSEWGAFVCVIAFFSGLQMMCIGVVGQYISKIYHESTHRPHYIAREASDEYMKKIF